MKALRSSPFLSLASALQVFILLCCAVGALSFCSVPRRPLPEPNPKPSRSVASFVVPCERLRSDLPLQKSRNREPRHTTARWRVCDRAKHGTAVFRCARKIARCLLSEHRTSAGAGRLPGKLSRRRAAPRPPSSRPKLPPMATSPPRPPCSWPKPLEAEPAPARQKRCAADCWPRRRSSSGCRSMEIAGPGFINIRLEPAAKQEVVREVLGQGARFGCRARERQAGVGGVRVCQPDRPAARGPWPPGRAGRCHLQPVSRPRAARCTASSITTTPVCRSTRWPIARNCAPKASSPTVLADGLEPGKQGLYNGDYIADIADRLSWPRQDRQGRRPRVHRHWRCGRPATASASSPWPTCAMSRTWTCRPLQSEL